MTCSGNLIYCTSLTLSILLPSPSVWWTESISQSCSEILETWHGWVESVGSFNHTLLSAWRFSLLFFKRWTHSDHWTSLLQISQGWVYCFLFRVTQFHDTQFLNWVLVTTSCLWILKFLQKSRIELRMKTCKRLSINFFLMVLHNFYDVCYIRIV